VSATCAIAHRTAFDAAVVHGTPTGNTETY
jgi:hypothetical protein